MKKSAEDIRRGMISKRILDGVVPDKYSDDAGKMARYMLRWRMRDDSTGAWAETRERSNHRLKE